MDNIHLVSSNKNSMTVETKFYNNKGEEVLDTQTVYASNTLIKRSDKNTYKYYVAYNNYGPEAGQPVNPDSNYNSIIEHPNDIRLGRVKQELKEVKKQKFDLYIRFLKTKNQAHLREMERL